MNVIESPKTEALAELLQKPLVTHKPPESIWLALRLPPGMEDYESLHRYMWEKYHIGVLYTDTDAADAGDLYYERTYTGWIGAIESIDPGRLVFVICPKHYVGWASDGTELDPTKPYSAQWIKLIADAEILGATATGPKVTIST